MDTIELAKLIATDADAQRRINDYAKAKSEAEDAVKEANAKVAEASAATSRLNEHLERHKKQMAEATAKHDAAASEAAARIKLANELDARNKNIHEALNAREDNLTKREGVVESLKRTFESALKQLQSV